MNLTGDTFGENEHYKHRHGKDLPTSCKTHFPWLFHVVSLSGRLVAIKDCFDFLRLFVSLWLIWLFVVVWCLFVVMLHFCLSRFGSICLYLSISTVSFYSISVSFCISFFISFALHLFVIISHLSLNINSNFIQKLWSRGPWLLVFTSLLSPSDLYANHICPV